MTPEAPRTVGSPFKAPEPPGRTVGVDARQLRQALVVRNILFLHPPVFSSLSSLLPYSAPGSLWALIMSYKRVKNVAGAPGGEDDAFDDDYEEEEEREFGSCGICLQY